METTLSDSRWRVQSLAVGSARRDWRSRWTTTGKRPPQGRAVRLGSITAPVEGARPVNQASSSYFTSPLAEVDPEIAAVLDQELGRQRDYLEMIASENFVPRAVLESQGSVLTNKYAEGYPGRRYYGGCEYVDVVESIAIERAKQLFGSGFANVQPHSGAQANQPVYHALLEQGDRVLGLDLNHGGHLTHGRKQNFSGRNYDIVSYGVDPETYRIDMDVVRDRALETRPK
ncbi:MAG: hypothetical protein J7480_04815, partial [Microbacteriaceae bacterium]|nr:hypothetical protein [Microbacteriaceae bacterium]